MSSSAPQLLVLYKQLLRACETYPSRNRHKIYQAIREEWRDSVAMQDVQKISKQVSIAYKGLSQLRQFDDTTMTSGNTASPNWNVTLEQNPMPKPDDYDERKKNKKT